MEVAQQACSAALESKSTPRLAHCSFDIAQQIQYPFDAQETGPEYFKTASKCGLFGVCDDGIIARKLTVWGDHLARGTKYFVTAPLAWVSR